jgi:hypothetical protein
VCGDDEKVVVRVRELPVTQQVGNTCTPRSLITALKRFYSDEENEATGMQDIDERAEDKDSLWLDSLLKLHDTDRRITVVDNMSMITDDKLHKILLAPLLNELVPDQTSFGLIVNSATAEQDRDARVESSHQMKHWVYFEVILNFNCDRDTEVHFANSQSEMEQGKKRHASLMQAAQTLAEFVSSFFQPA